MSKIPYDSRCDVFSKFPKKKMAESYLYGLPILYDKISKLYILFLDARIYTDLFQ